MFALTGAVAKDSVRADVPAATDVLDGRTTREGAPETSEILNPPLGALAFKVTVSEPLAPPVTLEPAKVKVVSAGALTATNVVRLIPFRDAVITTPVFAPTGDVAIENSALVPAAGMVTEAGTVAAGWLELRLMLQPPAGAAPTTATAPCI